MIEILVFLFLLLLLLLVPKKKVKKYGTPSISAEGIQVRSMSESFLADYFSTNGIQYEYENKLRIKNKVIHPDFYLPEHDVYVEYWGLVNADDEHVKAEYIRKMRWKMAQYHSNNIKFISIYPTNMSNLDWIFRKKFEKAVGYQLPYNIDKGMTDSQEESKWAQEIFEI